MGTASNQNTKTKYFMPVYNNKEILRLSPQEVEDRAIYDGPTFNVREQNEMNKRLHPKEVVQMVYIDGIYRGICYKRDKLWQVIEKFKLFL